MQLAVRGDTHGAAGERTIVYPQPAAGDATMGLLDKIKERLGVPQDPPGSSPNQTASTSTGSSSQSGTAAQDPDEAAVERYRYMLRTAPPERIEEAHAEAFAKLTPEQRRHVLNDLGNDVPPSERAQSDNPQSLARMATRAEMRQPGTMERSLDNRGSGGMGMGGMIAGSLLASVAGAFIGTAIAQEFLGDDMTGAEPDAGNPEDPGMDEPGLDDAGDMDNLDF